VKACYREICLESPNNKSAEQQVQELYLITCVITICLLAIWNITSGYFTCKIAFIVLGVIEVITILLFYWIYTHKQGNDEAFSVIISAVSEMSWMSLFFWQKRKNTWRLAFIGLALNNFINISGEKILQYGNDLPYLLGAVFNFIRTANFPVTCIFLIPYSGYRATSWYLPKLLTEKTWHTLAVIFFIGLSVLTFKSLNESSIVSYQVAVITQNVLILAFALIIALHELKIEGDVRKDTAMWMVLSLVWISGNISLEFNFTGDELFSTTQFLVVLYFTMAAKHRDGFLFKLE
jgi:hypothetical protein